MKVSSQTLNINSFNVLFLLVTILLLFTTGCSSMLFNYMFKDMDFNSDGGVDFKEYKSGQTSISLEKMEIDFNYIDLNKDGKITHEELMDSFEMKKSLKTSAS